jgi:polar amino acid transport system substrate-binding protein
MKNRRGELMGLDVDLAGLLAESMNLELRFVERPFAELLDALEAGTVDLVISGMTITPERNARVAFAGPYFISGKSALTRSKAIANVEDPAELDAPEHTFAVLAGSTSEEYVKTVLPRSRRVPVPDDEAGIAMVIDGEVDALFSDFPICSVAVLRYPEANLEMINQPFTAEPLGIALPPDDLLFVNLVENYLKLLDETGQLVELKARWFGHTEWLAELP